MSKKLFLTTILSLLSFLQIIHSSWAAEANKPTSQTQKNQASAPLKQHDNNLSVKMHGFFTLGLKYTNCDGVYVEQTLYIGNTLNTCVKEYYPSAIAVAQNPFGKEGHIRFFRNGQGNGEDSLQVTNEGVTMDCGGTFAPPFGGTMRCDYSTPFKPQ